MDMPVVSIKLYYFLEAFVDSINDAVENALKDSVDEPVVFIPSSIDMSIRCSLEYDDDGGVYVTPSNAFIANYYGKGNDVVIQAKLSPVPRSSRILASSATESKYRYKDR